jgi:hypothetical protein
MVMSGLGGPDNRASVLGEAPVLKYANTIARKIGKPARGNSEAGVSGLAVAADRVELFKARCSGIASQETRG